MADDPFSALLAHIDARAACAGGFSAGGDWAIAFPAPDKLKFFAIAQGACWLTLAGEAPIRLGTGDVLLLAARKPFVVATDRSLAPRDALAVFGRVASGTVRLGGGEDFFFLGGHVDIDSVAGPLFVESLPPLIHVRAGSAEAPRLQWLIGQLVAENAASGPGAGFACASLAQLVFLHVLRFHLAQSADLAPGWLRAFGDARIAPALRLMHAEPGRDWRLSELARAAAMSRTAFALYFKAVAGIAPLAWLTEWRMRLAAKTLRETDRPLSLVAAAVGYASESAFSTAFKRVTGSAPNRYRAAVRRSPEMPDRTDGDGEQLSAVA
jgi:AraC-like DNA-binding protein